LTLLLFRDLKERNDWLDAINSAVEDWRSRKATFQSADNHQQALQQLAASGLALGDQAPVNVPDERVTMCQACSTDFTLVHRRHHCRACGRYLDDRNDDIS
jgi:FYVE/RhoGEF/PH domain-containing protein 5/6